MNKRFIVRLSVEERSQLEAIIAKGKTAARKLTRARILLKADCSSLGPAWSDEQIGEALDLGVITVHRVRRSFVEGGGTDHRIGSSLDHPDGSAKVVLFSV
jgi:Homeodomain-like domain